VLLADLFFLQALIASLLANKRQLQGVETEGQLLRWLYHLQTDRGVLLPEAPGAASSAAAGSRKTMVLALPVMLQRLLAHRDLRAGHQLAVLAEDVLVTQLQFGANRPRRLSVPRMPLTRAKTWLQREVRALRPYLLVRGCEMLAMPGICA
jgi:hypothetical protein